MFNWNLSAHLLSFPNPWIGRIHLLPGTDSVRTMRLSMKGLIGGWGSWNSGPAYFIVILTASANKYRDDAAREYPTLMLVHCLRLFY